MVTPAGKATLATRGRALVACLVLGLGLVACIGSGDDGNVGLIDSMPDTTGKHVFATAATFTGDLGGAAGADATCQSAAAAAGRTGTWKAWVSVAAENAIDRIADVGPWSDFATPSAVIFASKAGLTGVPASPLHTDEAGQRVQLERAWTGTTIDGTLSTADGNCLDWSNATTTEFGHAGQVGLDSTGWTDQTTSSCAQMGHLFCFEQ